MIAESKEEIGAVFLNELGYIAEDRIEKTALVVLADHELKTAERSHNRGPRVPNKAIGRLLSVSFHTKPVPS